MRPLSEPLRVQTRDRFANPIIELRAISSPYYREFLTELPIRYILYSIM